MFQLPCQNVLGPTLRSFGNPEDLESFWMACTHVRTHIRTHAQRERDTHTQGERDTHTQRERETHTHTHRETHTHTHTQRERDTHASTHTHTHTHTERERDTNTQRPDVIKLKGRAGVRSETSSQGSCTCECVCVCLMPCLGPLWKTYCELVGRVPALGVMGTGPDNPLRRSRIRRRDRLGRWANVHLSNRLLILSTDYY